MTLEMVYSTPLKMAIWIKNQACLSAAGMGTEVLWEGLLAQRNYRDPEGICRIPIQNPTLSSLNMLTERLLQITRPFFPLSPRCGVILASTKGALEDKIWTAPEDELTLDPLTPILDLFLLRAEITPIHSIVVSNACASSHGALYLAQRWLESERVDEVLVLAVDEVGKFIRQGFRSLGALSPSRARPFSKDRDGLQLGEAAAAVLLSRVEPSPFRLGKVAICSEGHSVTRPSPTGKSLKAAIEATLSENQPDAIIAHGTATPINDATEDRVFAELDLQAPITATKGTMGHTLGTSGLVDLIAAIEMLKHQTIFPIPGTTEVDPQFKSRYQVQQPKETPLERILITSLGFGGTSAALVVQK